MTDNAAIGTAFSPVSFVRRGVLFAVTAALALALPFMGCEVSDDSGSEEIINAAPPQITGQPQDAAYPHDKPADPLIVQAESTDRGILSYQWYTHQNKDKPNEGGILIQNANAATYTPSTGLTGTFYYYVEVKNTNLKVNGEVEATIKSAAAAVTVSGRMNAAAPIITSHPQGATYSLNAASVAALTVGIDPGNQGTLSYQWYRNEVNSNEGGSPIEGATAKEYAPQVDVLRTLYYYVTVTNTLADNGDGGTKTAAVKSLPAGIIVNEKVNAAPPNITGHPQGATYNMNEASVAALTVGVTAFGDGVSLSYQWYSSAENSNANGTALGDAAGPAYKPPVNTAGTVYYYVEITGSIRDNGDGGNKTAAVKSNPAGITVRSPVNAAAPNIISHPQGATYNMNAANVAPLTVTAASSSGTLSYQWYRNTANSSQNGTLIAAATGPAYTPPVSAEGTLYYYVVVTNTMADNGDGGNKTASATSNAAGIIVTDPSLVAFRSIRYDQNLAALVLEFDKPIPGLTASDITAESSTYNTLRFNTIGSVLTGPTQDNKYTLPLHFELITVPRAAVSVTVAKSGYTISPATLTGQLELIEVRFTSMTASPDPATNARTEKIIFTFDRDIPGFSQDDIFLRNVVQQNYTGPTTAKQGLTHTGTGVYELAVSGYSSQPTGPQSQIVCVVKDGFRFGIRDLATHLGSGQYVDVYYEQTQVTGVTLSPTPTDTAIPVSNTQWPKTWTLNAAVNVQGTGLDQSVTFSVENGPVSGVTLTPIGSGGTAAELSIAESAGVSSVIVKAVSNADITKSADKMFIIERNVGVVADSAAFEAALAGTGSDIIIASPISTPSVATIMQSPQNIIIRNNGKLTVAEDFTAKGSIRVESGGTLEIAAGKTLTADQVSDTSVLFGNHEIKSLSGKYEALNENVLLSFNGAEKRLTIEGSQDATLKFTAQPAGTSASYKHINIPLGYSLMIKQDVTLDLNGYAAYDFGSQNDVFEAGFSSAVMAKEGNAVFAGSTEGLQITTAAAGGYIWLSSNLYCVPCKALVFPAPSGGYYPPKLVFGYAITPEYISYTVEPSSSGGVKLSVLGTGDRFIFSTSSFTTEPSNINQGRVIALKVERTGGGSGTLSFVFHSGSSSTTNLIMLATMTTFDLGGTSDSPLGSIILKKRSNTQAALRLMNGGSQEIKTGNAEAGAASFPAITPTVSGSGASLDTLSIKGNGSGKFSSISRTSTAGTFTFTNSSTESDFIINAATTVTEN